MQVQEGGLALILVVGNYKEFIGKRVSVTKHIARTISGLEGVEDFLIKKKLILKAYHKEHRVWEFKNVEPENELDEEYFLIERSLNGRSLSFTIKPI